MKKLLLVLFSILLLALAGCGSNPNEDAEKYDSIKAVKYRTATEKLSHHRYKIVAIVDDKVSKEEMENIAKSAIAGMYKSDKDLYGAYVFVTDTDIYGIPYTLSSYEYGPDSSASYDANKEDKKRTLKLAKDNSNKDWSKRPSQDDYKIFILYTEYLTKNPGGNEQQFIDQFSGKKPTAEQVRKSVDKVEAWII